MAGTSPRRSARAAAVIKARKPASPAKTRPTRQAAVKNLPKYLTEVRIDEDTTDGEDVEIKLESEVESKEDVESEGSVELSEDEEDEEEEEDDDEESISADESEPSISVDDEDEREIQRIIEKTAAETKIIGKTARLRAMAGEASSEHDEELMSLPITNPLTEEQLLKKSEKSRRRKMQRELKLEETKRATIERLLSKQRGSSAGEKQADEYSESSPELQTESNQDPNLIPEGLVRYIDRAGETVLIVPEGSQLFPPSSAATHPPSASSCSVCKAQSPRYKQPVTLMPFCSVACFRQLK